MIRKVIATLGVVSAALLGGVVPASAQTQAAPHCQWGNTYGTIVKPPVESVFAVVGGARVGSVELCRDSSYNYWGFAIYDTPMTASQYAQVLLQIYRDGDWIKDVSCDTDLGNGNKGNGYIAPNQTRCWTPKVGGVSGHYTFRARTDKYSSHTGALLASGRTVVTR
ncbi:hypothetical protein [Kibdelosporangium aridum]|uniref:Secreted protein n=1 Tax=Kibdelosporangium aridum TaxID=2030 RepID=A0A1Y5Y2G2_KIBAR|nr:hypothetical protein [Kibdelosporangium aridum]SMD22479.1 hypothetical protein SAMN05661093_07440 [Kibdelosporangium aridum]